MNSTLRLAAVLLLLVPACGGTEPDPGSESAALPCDVDSVLAASCRQCHGASPKFGAPAPLVTREDLLAPAVSDPSKRMIDLVTTRIHDERRPMPPTGRLSETELAILDGWAAAGTPAGSSKCEATGQGGGGGGGSPPDVHCTPDLTLKPAEPYVMPKDVADEYVCYGVTAKLDKKRHVTALVPRIDNSTILHHALLYKTEEAWPAEPAPCVGSDIAFLNGQLLAVWSPGGQALELPPEAGLPMEGDTHFVVQMHYSNLRALDGQQDSSGYDLCTTEDLRPNDAATVPFGASRFEIPAHGALDMTCDYKIPEGSGSFNVIAAMPHMHELGTHISSTILPSGSGEPVDLGRVDPWNFDNQVWYMIDATFKEGDTVRTRCAWENPGSTDVIWGERTNDEMCYSFVMYYPPITLDSWSWPIPGLTSRCSPTP
ncbi:peptidylglycine alpha-amidating monooxygenase [Sorangium sp. So ce1078]|uniref:monooxygenase n=1 Tax=Sorangium sp. So ce1078 TaxID=3133329 RepID=UPI003F5F6B2D